VTRRTTWSTVVTVAVVLVATGCTSSPAEKSAPVPGVTGSTITIGSTQPLSGVVAAGYGEISRASAAYFRFVNDHGGIHGRNIDYMYVDDAYNPKRTVRQTRKLVRDEDVFAVFNALGTATHQRVVEFLDEEQVPDLFVASGCSCWDSPHAHPLTFGWQPSYVVEGKILADFIASRFAGKKVGVFYQDDDFGRDGLKGIRKVLPAKRVVAAQAYDPSHTKITAQVRKLQTAGADIVVSFTIPAFTAILKLNMLKLHYDPRLVVSSAGSDPRTVAGLLEAIAAKVGFKVRGARLIQGLVTDGFLPTAGDRHNSWVQLFREVHDRYIPTLPFDGNVIYGMAAAYTFAQALQAAGDDPTRAGLVAAVERGLPAGPGLTPLGYSDSSHSGFTGAQVGIVKGQAVSYIGRPATTDDGAGRVRRYSGPPASAPTGGIPTG
jgi:ABC-type branched-subunit amino acid transport system substrate-binding protein